jgi:drug/metabolite transporter (DMT)-like permease
MVKIGATNLTTSFILSVLACLLAAICYGLTGIYIKKFAHQLNPKGVATGSLLLVGIFMLPFSMAYLWDDLG